jgi:beta-galactosidase
MAQRETDARRHLDRTKSWDYGRLSRAFFVEHGPPDWLRPAPLFSAAAHCIQFRSRHTEGAVWPVHDLFFNDILLWILPTHGLTLLLKFATVLAGLLTFMFHTNETATAPPQIRYYQYVRLVFLATLVVAWCIYYRRVFDVILRGKTWMDPTVPAINRLPMHVPMRIFSSHEAARQAACRLDLVAANDDGGDLLFARTTPNVWRLDDLKWLFCLKDTAEEGLELVERTEKQQKEEWVHTPVPSNWTLQGCKDRPIYTNQKYPWKCQPPLVPHQNPTGVYRLDFDMPSHWQSDQAKDLSSWALAHYTLLLHGIESACYVYMNHQFVGFSKDSRLPCEFDVTPYIKTSGNCLDIVVMRWSDGSYTEAQDQWWMAGIHRSVELIRRPPGADILDFAVQADASGLLNCAIDFRPAASKASRRTVQVELYNDVQLSAEGDWQAGTGVMTYEHTLLADQIQQTISMDMTRSLLQLWTAETPHLYTMTITLLEDMEVSLGTAGAVVLRNVRQVESCRVGFRTVDIHDGAVHVNGRPITVCGMNRHEHDPDHGKVVSLERMKQDVRLLK